MNVSVKVVNGKLICLDHNEPIEMIVMDNQVNISERLLCLKCFKARRQVSKYISIEEAQELIEEKLYKLTKEQEEQSQGIINELNKFQINLMNIRSRVTQQIDEILRISQLWITHITNYARKPDVNNFIEDLQILQQEGKEHEDFLNKSNKSHHQKIDKIFHHLLAQDDYQNCQQILWNIFEIKADQQENSIEIEQNSIQLNELSQWSSEGGFLEIKADQYENEQIEESGDLSKIIQLRSGSFNYYKKFREVELINTAQQDEGAYAIAFNNDGSIMVAGYGKDIKVWSFEQGQMIERKKLQGHTSIVSSLFFSKKYDWFVSGSYDSTIIFWEDIGKLGWLSSQPEKSHNGTVLCLIMNNQENELISCSRDKTIMIWKVNREINQYEYYQTLEERHNGGVLCISLNDSETALVSCDQNQNIILWKKEQNDQWIYTQELKMDDEGFSICFISEYQIIWQQRNRGISHFLEINQGKLIRRSDLNINFDIGYCDCDSFPTIRNSRRQVIIQKYNDSVYILNQQNNGQFSLEIEPIRCGSLQIYGNLTEDGEYLTIWDYESKQFQVYYIKYE